ncbi:hypothetical protein ABFS82_06G184000 [Erythranthe guttata]
MSFRIYKIFLLFLVIQACIPDRFAEGCSIFSSKRTVHIVNDLPRDTPQLELHCYSKDDDLGNHTLSIGQEFQWSFCPNVLPTTLFACHLWWFPKEKAFDAFKENIFKLRTEALYWIAKSDGIYFADGIDYPEASSKKYDWNK